MKFFGGLRQLVGCFVNCGLVYGHGWRFKSQVGGVRFLDLVQIYLWDYGYYSRLYRGGSLLVVYDSWLCYFFDCRSGVIAFEVGCDSFYAKSFSPEHKVIWVFGFYSSSRKCFVPRVVCRVTDVDCLDCILGEVVQHFGGSVWI